MHSNKSKHFTKSLRFDNFDLNKHLRTKINGVALMKILMFSNLLISICVALQSLGRQIFKHLLFQT